MSGFAAYTCRVLRAILNRPLDSHEALQAAVNLQEAVATGEDILSERISKSFGKPVMVKCVNESWILIAERGAPWGVLTQHTLSDVHFNPEVERDVLRALFSGRRLVAHPARYRPPRIGVIS